MKEDRTMSGTPENSQPHQEPSSPKAKEAEARGVPSSPSYPPVQEDTKKWGTHVMGPPAVPSAHPDNQKAASWNAGDHQQILHQPYVQFDPVERPSSNPLESVIDMFNCWSRKAETIACNIWHNRKTPDFLLIVSFIQSSILE